MADYSLLNPPTPDLLQQLLDGEDVQDLPDCPGLCSYPPEIIFDKSKNPFPVSLYISREDRILFTARTLTPDITLLITGRFLFPNGEINPFAYTIHPIADGAIHSYDFHMGEGFLLSLVANVLSPTIQRGTLYITAATIRGSAINLVTNQLLFQDYAHYNYCPTWPPGTFSPPTLNPGTLISRDVPFPDPGEQISFTVPTGARWRVQSVMFDFITNNSAFINIRLGIRDPNNHLVQQFATGFAQAPFQSRRWFWMQNIFQSADGSSVGYGSLPPDLHLPAGYMVTSECEDLSAETQFTNNSIFVEEWLI